MHQLNLICINPDGSFSYPTLVDKVPTTPISWSQASLQAKLAIPQMDFFDRVRSCGYAIWQNRWVVLWQADDQYVIAPLL
jgi:hypothetical protein